MKKIIIFLLFVIIVQIQLNYGAIQPPTSELTCMQAIITKFAYNTITNPNDVCSFSSYITCDQSTGSITKLYIQIYSTNGAIAIPSDFTCLPFLTYLQISNQFVDQQLMFNKLPSVTDINYNMVRFSGGITLNQSLPAYNSISIQSIDIDTNTLFKFSYLNNVQSFTLIGSCVPVEVDAAATKNILTDLRISVKNYPDLTGYTFSSAAFEIDNTFMVSSVGNFSSIYSQPLIRIFAFGPVPSVPFYLHQNVKTYQIQVLGAASTTMFTTPTSMIDCTGTMLMSITMDYIGKNFNYNGKFPLIFNDKTTIISFTNNGFSIAPNDLLANTLYFKNNSITSELSPKTSNSIYRVLDLTNNKVTGTIDNTYCQTDLVVTNNLMVGIIPSCFLCYLNSAISKTNNNIPAMYDRFTGNKFSNLNKTLATCPSFAPIAKPISTTSVMVTGIDIGLDVFSWYFNGVKAGAFGFGLQTGPYNHYNFSVSATGTFTGESFTAQFTAPNSRVFTFPVVQKPPIITRVVISGNQLSLSGSFFSSHIRHLEQTVMVDGIECFVTVTDFSTLVCNTSPQQLPTDVSIKNLTVTTGSLSGTVHIRTDSTPNNMVCPNNCTSNVNGICDLSSGGCTCNSGYTSTNCAAKSCPPDSLCGGKGNCNVMTGLCVCTGQNSGPNCQYTTSNPVCPNGCSGFGVCGSNSKCTCDQSHQGDDCSIPIIKCNVTLVNSDCNNNGVCDTTIGKCICFDGYQGELCNYPKYTCPVGPNSKQCNSLGSCDSTTGSCTCSSGFGGADCSIPMVNCPIASNNKVCGGGSNWCSTDGTCNCDQNHIGIDCGTNYIPCSKACLNGGSCDTTIGTCKCTKEWTGLDCTTFIHYIKSVNASTTLGGEASFTGVFGNAHTNINLLIDGLNCDITYNSSNEIKCIAPPGEGIHSVTLNQNGLSFTGKDIYKYVNINGLKCPSNCQNNGVCNTTTGSCHCNPNYGSYDCSPINDGSGNLGEALPPTNSTIDLGNGGSNIVNDKTNFEIYFKSLIEVDFNNNTIKKYDLQNKWSIDKNGDTNSIDGIIVHTLNQTLDNGCVIITKIQEITNVNGKEFEFAGSSFTISNGGIKFTIIINNYDFQSNLNTLKLEFISSVDQNKLGQVKNQDDCNSKDTQIDIKNVNDNQSDFNYIKISKDNKILSGRFINKLIADGRPTFFSSMVSNETDLVVVTLTLPNANEITIDPDFSVLLSSEFKSKCDSNEVDKRKSYIIPVAVVVSVVGVAAIIGISLFIYKKKKDNVLLNRLKGIANNNNNK